MTNLDQSIVFKLKFLKILFCSQQIFHFSAWMWKMLFKTKQQLYMAGWTFIIQQLYNLQNRAEYEAHN